MQVRSLHAAVAERDDEVLGDAAEAEAADHDGHAITENAAALEVAEGGRNAVVHFGSHGFKGIPEENAESQRTQRDTERSGEEVLNAENAVSTKRRHET
jgi:hypothetical protein